MKKNLLVLLFVLYAFISSAAVSGDKDIDYKGNLALIPASDPEVADFPTVLKELQGTHPRVLFTPAEINKLKTAINTDLFLKQAADAAIVTGKKKLVPLPGNPPDICTKGTAALASSFERYVNLAYAYVLTDGDEKVRNNIVSILEVMLNEPYWADTAELDCDMGAANNMFMVGVLFDTVYADLDPEFRVKMAEKILIHVRRMHYLGYKKLALDIHKYWQQDPFNNHRWHRNAGMTACLMAIADIPELKGRTEYLLKQLKEEVDFVMKWYPEGGDCHEGASYQRFGFLYLVMTARMWDRVTGTDYLSHPGFTNAWAQQLYYRTPDGRRYMSFGDSHNTAQPVGNLDMAFLASSGISRDKNIQAATLNSCKNNSRNLGHENVGWSLLAVYDPTVGKGDFAAIKPYCLFPDLGAASMRDSWEDDAVLFTFKCGPYGGYRLNEYRHGSMEDGKPLYVNVAHDDPDANSFALGRADGFLFHPGNYALKKTTDGHNTLLVDGKGQKLEGRQYTQPSETDDMRTYSYLTGWKVGAKNRIIIEGEAGPAYETLDRFRRSCIWMPGEYILILDSIRTADGKPQEISWQALVQQAYFDVPEEGRCSAETLLKNKMKFQILSNQEIGGIIDYKLLAGRFSSEMVNQFRFFKNTDAIKYVCMMDPWGKNVSITFTETSGVVTVTIKGDGINDSWMWRASDDLTTPSRIQGIRNGEVLIELTEADKAPHGH